MWAGEMEVPNLLGLGAVVRSSRSQHPAELTAKSCLSRWSPDRRPRDKTSITVRVAALPGRLRSAETSSHVTCSDGSLARWSSWAETTGHCGLRESSSCPGLCVPAWSCVWGNGPPTEPESILHVSATACPPARWAPTLDTKLPVWQPCKQHWTKRVLHFKDMLKPLWVGPRLGFKDVLGSFGSVGFNLASKEMLKATWLHPHWSFEMC